MDSDKRCVVGRTGHSAKTKARRGREIDVLIFPIQAAGSGLFCTEKGHAGKMCSLLFPFRRLLFGRSEDPSREASGQPGWRCRQRGGVRVKGQAFIATSFTIYSK